MPRAKRSPKQRRLWIWPGVALAVLLAAAPAFLVAYRVAARRLLSGPTLRALINARPAEFQIDWDAAESTRPGHAAIRNLRLRGSDPNVQWFATLASADVEFSVLALLRRHFVCTRLTGSGLAFALRSKLSPEQVQDTDLARLPKIPGFDDPPLKNENDAFFVEPDPFVIELRHVAVDRFDDIWINPFHYQGPARLEGGLSLKPLYFARIDAVALTFDGGALGLGDGPAGLAVNGKVTAASTEFAPLRVPIEKVPGVISADVALDLTASNLKTLAPMLSLPEGVRLEEGSATAKIATTLREGIANGTISVAVKGGGVRTTRFRVRGNATAEVPMNRWNLTARPFDVSGTKVALTDVHAVGATETRAWWGRFEVPSGRLGQSAYGNVALRCQDARPLLGLLGVQLPPWTNGLVKLDDFGATATVAAAPATVRVEHLVASGGSFKIQGDFAQDGASGNGAFLIESGILILGIEVTPSATKVRPLFAKQWYEKVQKEKAARVR